MGQKKAALLRLQRRQAAALREREHPSTPPQPLCCQQTRTDTQTATHTHTHKKRLQMREREQPVCKETIITHAKRSGANGQSVCDDRTINRTKTPRGEGGVLWLGETKRTLQAE